MLKQEYFSSQIQLYKLITDCCWCKDAQVCEEQ